MPSTNRTAPATVCLAAALLALAVFAGCGRETPAPATSTGATGSGGVDTEGRLVRRLENDIASLNPVLMTSLYEREVLSYVFDALVEVDSTMRPAPGVATRWEIS